MLSEGEQLHAIVCKDVPMIEPALDQVLRAQQECHHEQGGTDLEGGMDSAGVEPGDFEEIEVGADDEMPSTGY